MVLPQNGTSSFTANSPTWVQMPLSQPNSLSASSLSGSFVPPIPPPSHLPDPAAMLAANQNFQNGSFPLPTSVSSTVQPGLSPFLPPSALGSFRPANQNILLNGPILPNPASGPGPSGISPTWPASLPQDVFQARPSGVNTPFAQPPLPRLPLPPQGPSAFNLAPAALAPANDHFGNPSNGFDPASDYFASSFNEITGAHGQAAMPWMLPTPASPETSFLPEKTEKPPVGLPELPFEPEVATEETILTKPKPGSGSSAAKPIAGPVRKPSADSAAIHKADPIGDSSETALGEETDGAEAIAQEIKEIIQEALMADPDMLHKLQAMGLQEKLQNREVMLNELRANIQDVLKLVPDRLENRVMQAVLSRLNPEYQPLAEKLFQWAREPHASGQPPAKKGQHVSLMRRAWNWLFDRGSRSTVHRLEELLDQPKPKFKLLHRSKSEDFEPLGLMI